MMIHRPIAPLPPRAPPSGARPVPLEVLPERPLVSVIVPSFNQGAFIRETIESVLKQDYRPIEIIVIDGASTDGTLNVLEGYRNRPEVRWMSEPDRGVAEAVNKGLSVAQGQILAIQSSDDFYTPGSLNIAVAFLKAHPTVGLVFGDNITVDSEGRELQRSRLDQYSIEGFLSKEFYIPQPSAFFRREMIKALGGWDERYFVCDTELWLRMVFRTEVRKVDACLANRRMHEEQRDRQTARIVESYRQMIVDSPDIAALPPRLRRLAHSGVHLTAARYNPAGFHLAASMHLWCALFCNPKQIRSFWRSPLIVPGYVSIKVMGSRLKRLIGFKPRTR